MGHQSLRKKELFVTFWMKVLFGAHVARASYPQIKKKPDILNVTHFFVSKKKKKARLGAFAWFGFVWRKRVLKKHTFLPNNQSKLFSKIKKCAS